ncbi:hypothetical protein SPRG_21336 [Saprolegnia parasitica CBS 223.65]|uniref:Folate-Biopterin Transporter (FBT) Family n=1 Tax=Saprolegnia parasitica (strain CBS 223.65) TaxID=695850 RepID=A0A067C1E8_SAPPC|nr:hypothetical protein SPRG_21336 [Saprolegnia parasitica CBS 223.65]KDO20381.1 hypothetical protein SPRG_21336 [Saprolegnia parasitica CBS 223.65]|eukprot:XP_012208925.1 hypothetical protein SPRG_21336 [Saprolegnia parasitica CBS 223.65]
MLTKEPLTTERVSYIASFDTHADGHEYGETKTPGEIEDGALRGGDAPVYTSPEVLAILYQYAMVGIVYGGFTVMKYPILTGYFALETNVLSSATALLTLGWSLKVVFGMLNDCFPIFGYHRKPYMLIGWSLCALLLVVLASMIYATRFVFAAIIGAICGFCLNSERFAGDFDWDIGVNGYFWILAIPSVINIPVVWFFIKDTKHEAVQFSVYFNQLWTLVQKRAVWQVLVFNFFFNFFTGSIGSTAGSYVALYWAKVENLNSAIMGVVGNIIFAVILYLTGMYGTHWNWRYFLTIYDVYRNQWFYLGVPVLENIPTGINFVVGTYVIVELAESGNEGVMYGLLTTISNLPSTFGSMITNIIDGSLDYNKKLIKADAPETRDQVAYSYFVAYGSVLLGCFCVFLLPNQKAAVAELKKNGGSQPKVAAAIFFILFAVLCTSITGNLSSMFESTRCMRLAGGAGCKEAPPSAYLAGIFVPVGLAALLIAKIAYSRR